MNIVLALRAIIGRETVFAGLRASQQDAEVRVQMRQEFAIITFVSAYLPRAFIDREQSSNHRSGVCSRLGWAVAVGRLVGHDGFGASAIQEIDGHPCFAASVGGVQAAVEVGEEVDFGAVEVAGGEDAGHFHGGRGCVGVVVAADDDGVDEVGQELVLVGAGVLMEQSCGVFVADGDVARGLG